ncbi:histidine phosphatase family protein [Georgenia faecalis]|uniref:Histidine phosphatase family protein n=1 Tax=Georgenia faecalis TaxID=2483799 RepID=A0ABV9DD73_9MICO|nr:histidine phosphatase family protein [Georgenia faecalis]
MSATVVLARHGRTPWHEPVRYAGSSDIPLDEVGEAQADRLARWAAAAGVTALASSDLLRARRTAAAVHALTGLEPVVDARLRELDFGAAEGLTRAEARARFADHAPAYEADPAASPWPGGELPAVGAERATAAVRNLAADRPGGLVLAVAHSTIIRLVVCQTLGVPLRDYRRALPRLEPTALTTLLVRDDGSTGLLGFNVSPGVAPTS